jgi:hypothetical protein
MFHDDIEDLTIDTAFIETDDIRMIEFHSDSSFMSKSDLLGLVMGSIGQEKLHGISLLAAYLSDFPYLGVLSRLKYANALITTDDDFFVGQPFKSPLTFAANDIPLTNFSLRRIL